MGVVWEAVVVVVMVYVAGGSFRKWALCVSCGGMRHATSYDLQIDAGRCRDYIT